MFYSYYKEFRKEGDLDIPALIPQVYLHYDPFTLNQRGKKLFTYQRMDFMLLLSSKYRIVLEIDGKHHYSEGNVASPELYAEMVKADRELKLNGYDVYRFGGHEFIDDNNAKRMLIDFFNKLFTVYNVKRC